MIEVIIEQLPPDEDNSEWMASALGGAALEALKDERELARELFISLGELLLQYDQD